MPFKNKSGTVNKLIIITVGLLLLAVTGYFLLKKHVLPAKDFVADGRKKESPLDLRPDIIAKLQQLVKDGSDGLYLLSIEQIEPDILASKLDATNVSVVVDSAAFMLLQRNHNLPDDLFNISFHKLHIDGIGIEDLLHKRQIEISGITVQDPVLKVWHKKQRYNQQERQATERMSLYQRLTKQLDKIQIGSISISKGVFTDNDVDSKKVSIFREVSVVMEKILVDSSTQFAKNRFLFAQHAAFSTKDYKVATKDSLYEFRVGSVAINGEQHKIVATDVTFKPIGTTAQFERKAKTRQEMFTIILPKITVTAVNWWAMLHRESFIAEVGEISDGDINIYLNRSLPKSGKMDINNFPQQLLQAVPIPVSFQIFKLNNARIRYEEYSPQTKQTGLVSFDHLNGLIDHVSNITQEIKANKTATFTGNTLFMNKVPMSGVFKFSMPAISEGAFVADLKMGAMDHDVVNGFAAPLGKIAITGGHLVSASAHVTGNKNQIQGSLQAIYNDLHLSPLKAASDESGHLKKRKALGVFANILVKNSNPGNNGTVRAPDFSLDRGTHGNFFNFLWSAIKMGLLKLIGIPVSLGM